MGPRFRGDDVLLASFAFLETWVARTQVAGSAFLHSRSRSSWGSSRSRGSQTAIHRYGVQGAGLGGGFLHVGSSDGTQVVSSLQTAQPGQLVGLVQLLARGAGHVDV